MEIPYYKSGSRSLEFLCGHLREHAKGAIPRRSHLPGRQLLDMHVNAENFWEISERDLEFSPAAEQLAQGLHEDWLAGLSADQRKTNVNAVPWDKLDADTRDSNLAQAARIPEVLPVAGLRVERGKYALAADEKRIRKTLQVHADLLAEAEHNHWMVERMLAGWRYSKLTAKDKARKLHPLLIPYAQGLYQSLETGGLSHHSNMSLLRIFLSYGHDANKELVRRIKADLEKRGHDVWFDKSEIKFGDNWRRSITDGMAGSQKFVAFLSKHSMRDPGVCRDEIAIVLGVKGGNIRTILVESETEVQPPVNISHVQWLDMHDRKEWWAKGGAAWTEWYQSKLAEIIRVVESDENRRLAGEIETLAGHLKPIRSDACIYDLLKKGLFGRAWIFEAVASWRSASFRPGSAEKPSQPRALLLLDNVDHPALLSQEQMQLLADQPWARVLYTTRLAPNDFIKAGVRIRPLDFDRLPENQSRRTSAATVSRSEPARAALP